MANLSEQQVLQIRTNLNQHRLTLADLHKVPVDVGLSNETGFPYHGTIEYVSPAIDPQTGTLLVRGILPIPDRALLPGFFVRMRLPMGQVNRNALLVPDRAVQDDQGGRYLLVVNTGDVVEQRYVQLGAADRRAAGHHLRAEAGRSRRRRRPLARHPRHQGDAAADDAIDARRSGPRQRRGPRHDVEILHRASGPRQCAGDRAGADRRDLPVPPAGRAISERRAADRAGDDPLSRRQRRRPSSIRSPCRSSCRSTASTGMLYMESTSAYDGTYVLTVTFEIGTDPNMDQVLVQNRVQQCAGPAAAGGAGAGRRRSAPNHRRSWNS